MSWVGEAICFRHFIFMCCYSRHPSVLWAQQKNLILMTMEISNVKNEKIQLTENKLVFDGKGGNDKFDYHVDLEFYAPINSDESKQHVAPRAIYLQLKKKEEGPFWPRLLKDTRKQPFVRTDFSRWIDEDEDEDDTKDKFNFDNMDFSSLGGDGKYDMDQGYEDMPAMSSSDEGEQENEVDNEVADEDKP